MTDERATSERPSEPSRAAPAATQLSDAQRAYVVKVAPRVERIARNVGANMPQVNLDDLISAGHEGLVQAALRYEPSAGVPFSAFAHYRIRGAMIDCARRVVPAIRQRTRAQRALEATQAVLESAQREQTALSAAATRTLQERVEAAASVVAQATAAILFSKLSRVDPDRVVGRDETDAERLVLGRQLQALIRGALDECGREDRAMLQALYFDDLSMHQYAARVGKSVSTVSRRHARVVKRLASRLRDRVPT